MAPAAPPGKRRCWCLKVLSVWCWISSLALIDGRGPGFPPAGGGEEFRAFFGRGTIKLKSACREPDLSLSGLEPVPLSKIGIRLLTSLGINGKNRNPLAYLRNAGSYFSSTYCRPDTKKNLFWLWEHSLEGFRWVHSMSKIGLHSAASGWNSQRTEANLKMVPIQPVLIFAGSYCVDISFPRVRAKLCVFFLGGGPNPY